MLARPAATDRAPPRRQTRRPAPPAWGPENAPVHNAGRGPTEKAGVKNRHTPIENYAGFLKFGTHHRALQGTQVFRKKPASVRQ